MMSQCGQFPEVGPGMVDLLAMIGTSNIFSRTESRQELFIDQS